LVRRASFAPRELVETYRFRKLSAKTSLFAVVGYPLKATSSPPFFNKVYTEENIDAVYVPFPADNLKGFLDLALDLGIKGVSVTVPYKEEVLPFLAEKSAEVQAVEACNTIVAAAEGWHGYNTDSRGFSDSLLEFTGRKDLRGKRVTIIGAGGAARAVASEVYRLRGKALILNRTIARARRLAQIYKFECGSADPAGAEMMHKYNDIIIQTTSAGMEPDIHNDPLPDYHFNGKEKVLDVIYKPEETLFLKRAAQAGCAVRNGYDMLIRQAIYQYLFFMGTEFPQNLMNRIKIS